MAWTEYMSTDGGAPVLDGQNGSLVNVIRAIGVGYGAKPAAGIAEPFPAVNNQAMFRFAGGSRIYFQVTDNSIRAAPFNNACEARIKPSEAATNLTTQTGLFPTAAQAANGLIIRKSATNNATARPWIAYADDRTLIMFIKSGDYGEGWHGFYVGEFFSRGTETFNGFAAGRITEQIAATPTALSTQEVLHSLSGFNVVVAGHFVARSVVGQAQSAVNVGKHGAGEHSAVELCGLTTFKNPADGALDVSRLKITELMTPTATNRGRLRGMYQPLHPIAFLTHGDTFSGVPGGEFAGKTFRIIGPTPSGLGFFVVENSDTVEKSSV